MSALVKDLKSKYFFRSASLKLESAEIMETVRAHIDIEELVESHECLAVLLVDHTMSNGDRASGHVFSDSLNRFEDGSLIYTGSISDIEYLDADLAVITTRRSRYFVILLA